MLNVIVIAIVVSFAILLGAAYRQSKKTRQELISEMKEEILSNEPTPVEPPAPVEVKVVKEVAVEIQKKVEVLAETAKAEVKAAKEGIKAIKAEVKELIASQEAPAEKPKVKRRRGRPSNKKQNNSTK